MFIVGASTRVRVPLRGAQGGRRHPRLRRAGAGTCPRACERQTGAGITSRDSYSNSRKHIYPPKVINRPGSYIVCKNTCNGLIFEGFGKAELMHDFSPVADVSGPVSRLRWGVIFIS